jgi:hypothetical protein
VLAFERRDRSAREWALSTVNAIYNIEQSCPSRKLVDAVHRLREDEVWRTCRCVGKQRREAEGEADQTPALVAEERMLS